MMRLVTRSRCGCPIDRPYGVEWHYAVEVSRADHWRGIALAVVIGVCAAFLLVYWGA